MGDTDPHQSVSKNGKDRQQDRELRDLKEANAAAHQDIGGSVRGMRRMLWGLLLTGLGGLVAIISYITATVDSMHDDVEKIEDDCAEVGSALREHKAVVSERDRGLRKDVDTNERYIDKLRERLRMKD